jgi:hypothetical protein
MTTGNAALAWGNLFNFGTPTASSAATTTPASNLLIEHVATKWRGTSGATDNVTMAWLSDQAADTFMLNGLGPTFLATGTVRLQLTSNGGATGDVYDSTATAGIVDPKYGYAIQLLTSKTFRSAKWTLAQTGASYIEAGRGFVGFRTQVIYNYSPGATRRWMHNTKKTKSSGGQTMIDRASPGKARVEVFTLGWIDETQRWSVHEEIDFNNGDHTDVLLIKNPASTNLGRDSIWGLIQEVSEVTEPYSGADLYSKSYAIEERL